MKILAVDTSSMMGSVAISDGDKLIAESLLNVSTSYSERLLVVIDQLLKHARMELKDIDGFAAAIGPGSFTGLRIGLATVKGLASSMGKKLVGVSSLLSLAYNGFAWPSTVVPLIDARRGEVYAAAYKFDSKGNAVVKMEESAFQPDKLCLKLKNMGEKYLLIGDGATAYSGLWQSELKDLITFPPASVIHPRASNVAFLAAEDFKKGNVSELSSVAPNYIRKSDAEIKSGGA